VREFAAGLLNALIEIQGWIREELTDTLGNAATGDWWALAAILPLGVFFGAVHALTPGHGKMVLSSYLVGSRLGAASGAAVAGVLAATHIISAVVVATVAASLVSRTLVGVGRAPLLEDLSRGLLLLIGAWLLARAILGRVHAHGEGPMVGIIAGLIPCPLTFFAMFLATAKGVPQIGLVFAAAMLIGVSLTLVTVATGTVLARAFLLRLMTAKGHSIERFSRYLDGVSGVALILVGSLHFLRP